MINKNQYRLLCELTDKLLNVDGVKTERVAISMLHVMRAHPIFLSRYESLFVDLNSKLALIKKLYHFVFQSCIQLLKSLNSPNIGLISEMVDDFKIIPNSLISFINQ